MRYFLPMVPLPTPYVRPEIFGYPILSQKRVKLRTSNFVRIFMRSIATKARYQSREKYSRGRSQALPKIFRASIYRAHLAGGHLCDSMAFLLYFFDVKLSQS